MSGVTTWAARTVRLLRDSGERAGLLVHTPPGESVPPFLSPLVVGHAEGEPPIDSLDGRLEHLLPIYRRAIESVRPEDGSPTVVAPSVPGDCYGVVAALSQAMSQDIRIVSWIHSDNNYDIAVSSHYEPMIHAFVPVSQELEQLANLRFPLRAADIHQIDHAVDVPISLREREPIHDRPIRLVYTGRIVEEQKRISALKSMVEHLRRAAVAFELKIVGDGPSKDELDSFFAGNACVHLLGSVPPEDVPAILDWGDAWVLPSRYEGQSVALLEAMAHGCVPIVTRINSGIDGIVNHGQTGLIVNSYPEDSADITGQRLAQAVERFSSSEISVISKQAHDLISSRHTHERYGDRVREMVQRVRADGCRVWPPGRPAAFTTLGQSSTTPFDAEKRMGDLLAKLSGRRVLLYGAGRHTTDLANVFARHSSNIVGVIDDHAAFEQLWGWPVIRSSDAGLLQATDVVISSSIHEENIWRKRGDLESKGLTVHRLYCESDVELVGLGV